MFFCIGVGCAWITHHLGGKGLLFSLQRLLPHTQISISEDGLICSLSDPETHLRVITANLPLYARRSMVSFMAQAHALVYLCDASIIQSQTTLEHLCLFYEVSRDYGRGWNDIPWIWVIDQYAHNALPLNPQLHVPFPLPEDLSFAMCSFLYDYGTLRLWRTFLDLKTQADGGV